MGLFDKIFRRKDKKLGLPVATRENAQDENGVSEEKQEQKENVRIYSKTEENGSITYEFKIGKGETVKKLGHFNNGIKDKYQYPVSLLQLNKEMQGMIQLLEDTTNPYARNQLKKHQVEKLEEMEKRYPGLTWTGAKEYIEQYGMENITKLKGLPTKIDISKLSKAEIEEYGKFLVKGLETFHSIRTADDTVIPENKEAILEYMKEKEKDIPDNPIVSASLKCRQDGTELDRQTVLKIAEQRKLISEDHALNPTYFQDQERLVLKEVYSELRKEIAVKNGENKNARDKDLAKIEYIREEIANIQEGFSSDLSATVMNFVNRTDVKSYIEQYMEKDKETVKLINEKYSDMPDDVKTNILTFLHARIGSYGQLAYKGDSHDTRTLRDVVANTDFKSEDDKVTRNFLLKVAKTAEEDIRTQYGPLIDKYMENLPFKERLKKEASIGKNNDDYQQYGQVIEPKIFNRGNAEDGKGEEIA